MRIHVLSLGCARNLVDSEGLSGLLEEAGHCLTQQAEEAECVVVNSCSFIREAEEESISAILALAEMKRKGTLRRLYVAGCLPQKRRSEREDLLNLLPEVDGFLGPGDLPKLPILLGSDPLVPGTAVPGTNRFFITSPVPTLLFDSFTPRRRMTPGHFAYLKISEGCDHACTFCSIPQFRGPHRSRSIEDLVRQAQRLAGEGVVELNLIGQDTSYYGADRYGRPSLPALLQALAGVEGIRWLRILYAHPAHMSDDLIRAIRDLAPVVKYVDIPLQHISDRLLAAMRRETDGESIRRLVDRLRKQVPDIALRTTFIVGFPGETEQEVEQLAGFLREARFERVGVFRYSPEPKTPSEKMAGQPSDAVKQERLDRLMRLQREISEENNRKWLDREIEVLVDEITPGRGELVEPRPASFALRQAPRPGPYRGRQGERRFYLGRTYADAPEVDGQVFLSSSDTLQPGRLVRARVIDSTEYDLVAEQVAG